MAATAVACGARAVSGSDVAKPAPQQPRSFTTVLDLTHTLYEGFPTFDTFSERKRCDQNRTEPEPPIGLAPCT